MNLNPKAVGKLIHDLLRWIEKILTPKVLFIILSVLVFKSFDPKNIEHFKATLKSLEIKQNTSVFDTEDGSLDFKRQSIDVL